MPYRLVPQRPANLPAELPDTAYSCSRHGMAAARLSSERPGSATAVSKTFIVWQYFDSFSDWAKREVHSRTGHEGPEGQQRYGSNLSARWWGLTIHPSRFTPGEETRWWVGLRAGLNSWIIPSHHRDSIPGPSSPQPVAFATDWATPAPQSQHRQLHRKCSKHDHKINNVKTE